jgi:hypothetical protein
MAGIAWAFPLCYLTFLEFSPFLTLASKYNPNITDKENESKKISKSKSFLSLIFQAPVYDHRLDNKLPYCHGT